MRKESCVRSEKSLGAERGTNKLNHIWESNSGYIGVSRGFSLRINPVPLNNVSTKQVTMISLAIELFYHKFKACGQQLRIWIMIAPCYRMMSLISFVVLLFLETRCCVTSFKTEWKGSCPRPCRSIETNALYNAGHCSS